MIPTRKFNLLFALLLVASAAFVFVSENPVYPQSFSTTSSSITTTTTSATTITSTTSTTTQTSSTSTSLTSTTTASFISYTTTLTRSFLNVSIITIPGGSVVTEYVTNTLQTITTVILQLTTSTITTTASSTTTGTISVPFPIGIPGFPTESVALGLLFGLLTLMLLRRKRGQINHRHG
jgi:hypothetical protein